MRREDLVAAFAEAAAETVPQEVLDFMDASGGARAKEIAFGMLTAIWSSMRMHGEFELLEAMSHAVAAVRVRKAGAS